VREICYFDYDDTPYSFPQEPKPRPGGGGGGGGGGQTQQRRQSDCDRFVDTLVKVVDETKNSPVSDAMLGRLMLLRGKGMHNKSLGVSGFQEKYWMGNQGGELYAHILAHAGARLIGSDTVVNYMGLPLPILPQQNLTDRTAWTGNGLSQAAYEHDLNEADIASNGKDTVFAMEKSAEVFGDIAGMQVAKLMRAGLLGTMKREDLRAAFSSLLCQGN
ncbi:MAG: hypothetical protein MN733_24010, partial [Nitrososphaera sp.]|nr:hypothetical protein [Nitrososphaera sp.]